MKLTLRIPFSFRWTALPALALLCAVAWANEDYPNKTVKIVVPFPPAGINDVIARQISEGLSRGIKGNIVIDNRGGAGGTLGSAIVAKAPADGYTLLFSSSSTIAVSPSIYPKLPYDPITDFSPITQIAKVASVLIVNNSLPVNTLDEFIAYVKANPNKVTFGSGGPGSAQHLAGELMKTQANLAMTHIPYQGGGPAMNDLMAGHISAVIELMPVAFPLVRGGKVKALAVSTPQRSALLPNLPAIAESVPGYDMTIWLGLLAPPNTPKPIVDKLNAAARATLRDPEIYKRLTDQGATPVGDSPEEFSSFVRSEVGRWAKVVKAAGL